MKEVGKLSEYDNKTIEYYLEKYGDMVYRLAYINMKNRHETDDIYQDVFLKLLLKHNNFVNEEHLKSWLIRITINCCKDYWKSAWYKKRVSFEDISEEMLEHMDKEEEKSSENVTDCVKRLPTKYKQVIHLYYYEQYSQKEIANILDISENTVATRMARGRKLLKKYLEREGREYEV